MSIFDIFKNNSPVNADGDMPDISYQLSDE